MLRRKTTLEEKNNERNSRTTQRNLFECYFDKDDNEERKAVRFEQPSTRLGYKRNSSS